MLTTGEASLSRVFLKFPASHDLMMSMINKINKIIQKAEVTSRAYIGKNTVSVSIFYTIRSSLLVTRSSLLVIAGIQVIYLIIKISSPTTKGGLPINIH